MYLNSRRGDVASHLAMGTGPFRMTSDGRMMPFYRNVCAICIFVFVSCGGSETRNESTTMNETLKKQNLEASKSADQRGTQQAEGASRLGEKKSNRYDKADLASEVENAHRFIRQGAYEQAILYAKNILQRDEKYVPAMLVIARAQYHLKKYEFSESICDTVISIDSKQAECFVIKGFIAQKNGNDPLARELFEKASKANPNYGVAWLNLGAQYLKVKNYEAASSALSKAVELMPERPEGFLNLGSALRGLGQVVEAQKQYERALKLKSNYPEAYFNLGILYLDAPSFPGVNKMDQYTISMKYFGYYKRQRGFLNKEDPSEAYIKEAQKAIEREQRFQQNEAKRKAREAAKAQAEKKTDKDKTGKEPIKGDNPKKK